MKPYNPRTGCSTLRDAVFGYAVFTAGMVLLAAAFGLAWLSSKFRR